MTYIPTVALFAAQLTTATSEAVEPVSQSRTFQASVAGTGAVTATVIIEYSNEQNSANTGPSSTALWVTAGTITLSGTTNASDGFASVAAWRFARARLTAVSGTGAAVTVTMGVQK